MEQQKHTNKLEKIFGLKMAIIMVMSAIIGSGIFKKVAPMSKGLQSPTLVVLAWVLAGVIILFGVWSIAELGTIFPHSGGPFSWLEKIYGRLISFLYGWASFTVIQSAAIASVAYVFAGALGTFIPLPHLSPAMESMSFLGIHFFSNVGAKAVTCILIIVLTIVNIKGTKNGGLVSLIFTFSIITCLCIIVCAAITSHVGSWQTFATKGSDYPAQGFTFLAFISLMVIAMRNAFWGYEGWIALGFIGEELQEPKKNMPKALTIGIIIIMLFYAVVNWAYLYVMPIDEITKGMSDPNYIGAVAVINKIFGNKGAYIVSGMILISTFGCTNATSLVSARIYYAMGRKGLFFKDVGDVHPKNKTPHKALIYQCVWACILALSGSFAILTDLVIIAAFIFYGLIVFGVIILRIKRKDLERPYKTFGYPFVPIIFTLFCLVLLSISLVESPIKSLVGVLLILSGLPFYYYWRKREPHLEYLKTISKT
ncbi:MAG TPA: amino acid permease [Bacteroidia bacterium]|nr:amino acid permease [Bacteroidia bacterium]